MQCRPRQVHGRVFPWRSAAPVLAVLLALGVFGQAAVAGPGSAFDWKGAYAGIFTGYGRADNRIVDVEGFANWGNAGWTVDYDKSGLIAGGLVGKPLRIGGLSLRIEVDAMIGRLPASSNRLDPEGLDETVKSAFRWVATARGAIEHSVGPVVVFAGGGPAVAGLDSSVTDIDFGAGMPTRQDPDDSFRERTTKVGWSAGLGIEAPLSGRWTMRLEGSYFDFGRSIHYVNRSGDGRCGPGNPRKPCRYETEHRLGLVRLAIIHRFNM